jgi:hypothetical protein
MPNAYPACGKKPPNATIAPSGSVPIRSTLSHEGGAGDDDDDDDLGAITRPKWGHCSDRASLIFSR